MFVLPRRGIMSPIMDTQRVLQAAVVVIILVCLLEDKVDGMSRTEKRELRDKVVEMFNHGYRSYMDNAYPADELMPLSCRGRYRGKEPSRGDIDDALGNFSLTLVDSLDTLVLLGELEEFERAVRLVIRDVSFDNDIVVSLFETNIRMLGGLLGGHVVAIHLKKTTKHMEWYNDELLEKAKDLGYRLLPAFNTTTGIPYPRVNLRHGVKKEHSRAGYERDTCTSCAGTLILEFAALSRLTGDPIFEQKADRAMEVLWQQRHRASDLVGLVINIHNGDWVRRESGVGAGIDSYYEYLFKAYIMLGDEAYLERFNKHYDSIMRYISQGPMMVDVHMHKPMTNSKNFMDALLAFWPGLQVLKGDIRPAIETHEMLYQVTQRHNFLPEAFTTDFRIHWGQHPLRPEFVESTYFLYKATSDPYYLDVGKSVLENLNKHARVKCGFAAIKDVSTGGHDDQMDSYVLAETFKYLYLLFSEKEDQTLDVDDYIFTTEAHLLPLSLSIYSTDANNTQASNGPKYMDEDEEDEQRTCPNANYLFPNSQNYAHTVRNPLKNMVQNLCPKPNARWLSRNAAQRESRLRASQFIAGNKDQLEELRRMGIRIATMKDGRVQLLHTASEAASQEDAEDGMLFMQEMIELSKSQQQEVQQEPRVVQLLSLPHFGSTVFSAGPAQFGLDLKKDGGIQGYVTLVEPLQACQAIQNAELIRNKIAVMERGDCMFIDKARQIQSVGAIGGIVIDSNDGTSSETSPLFAMSGDGVNDIIIPMVFLFRNEGNRLKEALSNNEKLEAYLGFKEKRPSEVMREILEKRNRAEEITKKGEPESSAPLSQGEADMVSEEVECQSESIQVDGQSEEVSQSEMLSEKDTAKTLLDKYMLVKMLKLGDLQIQIKQNVAPPKDADSLMAVIEGPNNARQVSIELDDFINGEGEQKINDVYEELISLLQSYTNFGELENQNDYLKAIADLVEAALSGGLSGLPLSTQQMIDELAKHLQTGENEANVDGVEGSEAKSTLHSYATQEELEETGEEKYVQSSEPSCSVVKDESSEPLMVEEDITKYVNVEYHPVRDNTVKQRKSSDMNTREGLTVNQGEEVEDSPVDQGNSESFVVSHIPQGNNPSEDNTKDQSDFSHLPYSELPESENLGEAPESTDSSASSRVGGSSSNEPQGDQKEQGSSHAKHVTAKSAVPHRDTTAESQQPHRDSANVKRTTQSQHISQSHDSSRSAEKPRTIDSETNAAKDEL